MNWRLLWAIFAGGLALTALESARIPDGCLPFLPCLYDKIYNPVARTPDNTYMKKDGSAAVPLTTMYVNAHGKVAFRPDNIRLNRSYREVTYYKAFLEVQEDGKLFDSKQRDAILDKLDHLKSADQPVYVVTYIHGWHHNADSRLLDEYEKDRTAANAVKFDNFTARYAELSRRMYELNGSAKPPIVVGIYVGWRGESIEGDFLSNLSLGTRAKIADRIGNARGENTLHETLSKIADKMHQTNEDNRMTLFGHSFGGRLLSMMVTKDIARGNTYPFGKRVMMAAIEPAIGADCFDVAFATPKTGNSDQIPSFIILTSEDDSAVGKYYPWSLWVPGVAPASCNKASRAASRTIGNYPPYLTHRMDFEYYGDTDIRSENYRDPYLEDKKTLRYPLASLNEKWLSTESVSFWRYVYIDAAGSRGKACSGSKCYVAMDSIFYSMALTQKEAFNQAGAIWNIQADRKLIDKADNPGRIDGQHNGYVSTNLTNFLMQLSYWGKTWTAPSSLPLPKLPQTVSGIKVPMPVLPESGNTLTLNPQQP